MVLSGFFVSTSAFAEAGQGVQFTVGIDETPVMEITLKTTELYLGLSPQMASADFSETDFSVTVGTSNKTGYNLNMTATSTNLTRTQAISGETPTMQTLDAETSAADFTTNRWGFRKGLLTDENPTYSPVALTNPLASNEEATNGITTNLVFAAKADSTQPAGDYTTTLNFIATANPTVTYIQDLDPTLCTKADSLTVVDSRDGQEYTVQRLNDNRCWMTKNLNLAGGKALSADDTDVDSTYISGFTTQAGLTKSGSTITIPASTTSGFSDNATAYVYNSTKTSGTDCSSPGCYSYYSWIAATLGGKQANGSTAVSNYYNAAASICPKGWRLPTSTTSNADARQSNNWKTGDFYALATAYGANLASNYYDDSSSTGKNFYNNAGPGKTPNFLLTGSYNGGSFNDGGSYGPYWSSTSYSSTNAYNLNFNSSYVDSANGYYRRYGFGVRCILRETRTPDDVQYMQDMNSDFAANMESEKTYTVKDQRDEQDYTIAKLADGKVWMTKNLNLAGGKALSANDTDVDSTYISGFTTQGGLTKSGSTITIPASTTSGFSDNATAYVYNSTKTSGTDCSSPGCYSYYSWLTATLGGKQANGSTAVSDYYNAAASICPKGWRLPTSTTSNGDAQQSNRWKTGDFYALAKAYGANLESNHYQNAGTFTTNAGPSTTPNFLLTGYYGGGSFYNGGSVGLYWSSTSYSSTSAYFLYFNSSSVHSANLSYSRKSGIGVRCILR